jgi:nitrate reductase (NAD(P)H)
MMQDYHIGSLDEASRQILHDEGPEEDKSSQLRELFLQSKVWTKAILSQKTIISSDTRIFRFDLEYKDQRIGLPVGQHLMMRLRDPLTHEAIIRSYTPISEGTDKGKLDVLVKVYFDTAERKGGKMTKALDQIPVGHFVDFKGPIGKFEYLGKGKCMVGGKERYVKRFIMICGGSGITPIFQVLRAVLRDDADPTNCLVLDGNRLEEDILCRDAMNELVKGREHRCDLLYTLTKPPETWTGLKGRIGKQLLEERVGKCKSLAEGHGEDLVLICGPEALEKSVHGILNELGWKDSDLLFF